MSDILVLNEGGKRMRRRRISRRRRLFRGLPRVRIPRLRMGDVGGIGELSLDARRRRKRSFPRIRIPRLRMDSIGLDARRRLRRGPGGRFLPRLRMDASMTWPEPMKTYVGRKMRRTMRGAWRGYHKMKRTGLFPYKGLRMEQGLMGLLPKIDIMNLGATALGVVAANQVPKLEFLPDIARTQIGKPVTQILVGIVGNAIAKGVLKRPDVGFSFFNGAVAYAVVENILPLVGLKLTDLGSLAAYIERPKPFGAYISPEPETSGISQDGGTPSEEEEIETF